MKNRKRPFYNQDKFYYYLLLVLSIIYLYFALWYFRDYTFDGLVKRLTTLFAVVSAVTFWLNFKRTERLNESNYALNLNNQFIGNKDMTKIEHELELYYNQYNELLEGLQRAGKQMNVKDVSSIRLGLNLSRTSDECQKLINYLVYLESMAIMVENGVLHIRDIDDLFSYRFFLAVNNPIVQEQELLPYSDFYRGIYGLSERWVEDHNRRKIPIPIAEFCLTEKRLSQWKKYHHVKAHKLEKTVTVDYSRIPVEYSFVRGDDNKEEIALCLYETDPFIYPQAFGDDREKAVKAISRIIGMDGSLFDYSNLYVARYNKQICGVCCIHDKDAEWKTEDIQKRIGDHVMDVEQSAEGFKEVSDKYFLKIVNQKLPDDEAEFVAVCVEEGFRAKGIGKEMLQNLLKEERLKNKTVRLTALADNEKAIGVYKAVGFESEKDEWGKDKKEKGFGPRGSEPEIIEMVRDKSKPIVW